MTQCFTGEQPGLQVPHFHQLNCNYGGRWTAHFGMKFAGIKAIEEKNKQPFPWEPTRFPCSDQKSLEVVWGGSMPVPFHAGSTGTSSCLISWGSINNICQSSPENRRFRNKQAVLTPQMIHYSWSVLTSLQEKTGDGNRQEWGDDTCTSELT